MEKFNFDKEWDFIIAGIHNEKTNRKNSIKRMILFAMQILLSKTEKKKYLALKKIYCKN